MTQRVDERPAPFPVSAPQPSAEPAAPVAPESPAPFAFKDNVSRTKGQSPGSVAARGPLPASPGAARAAPATSPEKMSPGIRALVDRAINNQATPAERTTVEAWTSSTIWP